MYERKERKLKVRISETTIGQEEDAGNNSIIVIFFTYRLDVSMAVQRGL